MRTGSLLAHARRLRGATALVPAMFLTPALAQSPGNVIIPDGRTQTRLNVTGQTTDITTTTIRGANAYNSFSRFEEAAGNTVNLHVPSSSRTLVNIVRDGPVLINGVLNGYKNGNIGGNVVFSDSYGFVVGKSGQVNVGSLTVNTPTREFLDTVIDRKGNINEAAAARLIKGDVPLSPDGAVVINGRINARNAVRLHAAEVTVGGPERAAARHRARFESTVNVQGLRQGTVAVVRGGSIEIVAGGSARIAGRLAATGTVRRGGTIAVRAGADIQVAQTARIRAAAVREARATSLPARPRAEATRSSGPSSWPTGWAGGARPLASGGSIKLQAGRDLDIQGQVRAQSAGVSSENPNGKIDLTAGRNASVAGTVAADGATGRNAGEIGLRAGGEISLLATAKLSAAGRGDGSSGGKIIVFADENLKVLDHAGVSVGADTRGDGGFVELSAKNTVTLGDIGLDLVGAGGGKAGTLLIDPADIVVGFGLGTNQVNFFTNGGDVVLEATSSITMHTTGVIDTRHLDGSGTFSTQNSGSVTLDAPSITISAGAKILADIKTATGHNGAGLTGGAVTLKTDFGGGLTKTITISGGAGPNELGTPGAEIRGGSISVLASASINNFAGAVTNTSTAITIGRNAQLLAAGNISIKAESSTHKGVDTAANARATIDVAGTISGGAVDISSDSIGSATYKNPEGALVTGVQGFLSTLLGINGSYVGADVTARVSVKDGASVTGTGNVRIQATAFREAGAIVPVVVNNSLFAIGVVFGELKGATTAEVASGATLSSGGNLNVVANATNILDVNTQSFSTGTTPVALNVAVGKADLATSAVINSGVTIAQAGSLSVLAQNKNNFAVAAGANALDQGTFAVGLSYSDTSTTATARFGATVPTNTDGTARIAGNLTVLADSNTEQLNNSAGATVGNGILAPPITAISNLLTYPADKIKGLIGGAAKGFDSGTDSSKGAISLALAFGSQTATASIAGDTESAAPSVTAGGDAAVLANAMIARGSSDNGLRSNTTAAIENADAIPVLGSDPNSTTNGISLGAAVGIYKNTANAFIQSNAAVTADHIGVRAETSLPIRNVWLNFDGPSAILGKLNSSVGVGNQILTSFARAQSAADDVGFAGSVNYFSTDSNTTAWVGSGAQLTQRAAGAPNSTWTTTIDPLVSAPSVSWNAGVVVQAISRTETIGVGGDFSFFKLLGNAGGTAKAKSIGGSANVGLFESHTVAGIGANASVKADGGLKVDARGNDVVFSISPTSGSGDGAAVNGIVAVTMIDNDVSASISKDARIDASKVDVTAEQGLSLISGAGSFGLSTNAAIGVSLSFIQLDTNTRAFIGDNSGELGRTGAGGNDTGASAANSAVAGFIKTGAVNVEATTSGRVVTVSVTGEAAVDTGVPRPPKPPKDNSRTTTQKITDALSAVGDGAKSVAKVLTSVTELEKLVKKASTAYSEAKKQQDQATNPTISVAGSASVNVSNMDTLAYIDGAVISGRTAGSPVDTSVTALNNTLVATASGSAALSMTGGAASTSAAFAGAVAVSLNSNNTDTHIAATRITDARDVTVQALAGGQETTIGLALTGSSGGQSGGTFSASVSLTLVRDSSTAYIDGSTLTGVAAGSGAVAVGAYRSTDIAAGGGSLYLGGMGGLGFALSYADIGDPSGGVGPCGSSATCARMVDTALLGATSPNAGFATLTVGARDVGRIAAGAAVIGGGANQIGVGGAVVVANITNDSVAGISADPTHDAETRRIRVSGSVDVTSASAPDSALAAKVEAVASRATSGGGTPVDVSGTDFSGADVSANSKPGAAIIAVAGLVQFGKSNVGLALVDSTISQAHSATIGAGVLLSTSGDVAVRGSSDASILGIAIGVGVATGEFAGVGSVVVNRITNTISASIGSDGATATNTTVTGRDVTVEALDGSNIRGAAGAIAFAIKGSAAVGLSVVYDEIGNTVSADLNGAGVSSSRDVKVRADSTSDILTVALGVAISKGAGLAGSVATSLERTNVTSKVSNGADVDATNNVAVLASNVNTIAVIAGAAGVSTGSGAGVGLSLVVNDITGNTKALIDGTATKVDARGQGTGVLAVNTGELLHDVSLDPTPTLSFADLTETTRDVHGLAVSATAHQSVITNAVSAGLAFKIDSAGVAITPVVNTIRGRTEAGIDGAQIGTRLDVGASGRPDLAVAASSHSTANNFVVALATGTFGGSGALSVNVMSRTTDAHIKGATVGHGAAAQAAVAPTYTVANPSTGVPPEDADEGTATGVYNAGSPALPARSGLAAASVQATSSQTASDTVVAAAIGGLAGAGSVVVNTFSADTLAAVDKGSLVASSLGVTAKARNGHLSTMGTAAGGGAAYAGGFSVNVTSGKTEASIGNDATTTKLALLGALAVTANSNDTFRSYVIGGSLGGGSGIAGMASVEIATAKTRAATDHLQMNATVANGGTVDLGQSGPVTVQASQDISITPTIGSGAVGAGGAGVGAGANVVTLKGSVAAEILNSDLASSGTVAVTATGTKSIETKTITAGVGASFGLGAAVAVVIAGTQTPDGALNELDKKDSNGNNNGTLTQVNAASNVAPQSDTVNSSTPGSYTPAAPTQNVVRDAVASTAQDGVTAKISGGTLTAGTVTVAADGKIGVKSNVYGVGAGGVGVGASIGYTRVYDTVIASVDGGTVNTGALSVTAAMADKTGQSASEVKSYAGAGGLAAAVGAAVADTGLQNTVSATIGGTITGGASSNAVVSAKDTTSASTVAFGATVGGGAAVGASIAKTEKTSLVASTLTSTASVSGFNGVNVSAEGSGAVSAEATAGVGGVGVAAFGSSARATDNATIIAEAGRMALNAALGTAAPTSAPTVATGAGGLIISATATPKVDADSLGVAVAGGAAFGVAQAFATASPHVTAQFDSNGVITGGGLTVAATIEKPSSGNSATADGVGGSGAIWVGAAGVSAEASNSATALAKIGDNVALPLGAVEVTSMTNTSQDATATGVAVGYLSIGVAVGKATSNTSSKVEIGNSVTTSVLRTAAFIADADGTNSNTARGIAGSGGVFAGAGATGDTSDTSTVSTTVGSNATITGSLIALSAKHTSEYNASSNSISAAALNASASLSNAYIRSTVKVVVGNNSSFDANAYGLVNCATSSCIPALAITAQNDFRRTGTNASATGGAGGILTGAASGSTTNINQDGGETTISLGSGLMLTSGYDAISAPGSILLLAKSNLSGNDEASLTTGGLIQGAGVDATGRATLDNTISIGAGADIWTAGLVDIATVTTTNFGQSANVATYGLAAVGLASATSDVTTNQKVDIAASTAANPTSIVGLYNVNLTPGRFVDGGLNTSLNASASAQGEVRGLIAVPHADATARITSNSALTVGANANVKSAQNVTVGAYTGDTAPTADGTGRGYILGFIPATSRNSSTPVTTTSTVTIDGSVAAGVFNNQQIVIDQVNGQFVVNKDLKRDPDCLISCTLGTTLSTAGQSYRVRQATGAPVDLYLDNSFNPQAFVQARITGGDIGTVRARENALAGVSGGTVQAVRITSGLYAAGGLVTLNAGTIAGSGSLTANGGPVINVRNNTAAYLAVEGGAQIPDTPGGTVLFTGAAGRANRGSLQITENGATASPTMSFNNAYPNTVAGSSLGPALFLVGPVTNAGGLLFVGNAKGSYLGLGTVTSQTSLFDVPNGTFTINANGPGEFYAPNAADSAWKNAVIFPGGNPRDGAPNAEAAINYVGNAIFKRGNFESPWGYETLNAYDPNSGDAINQAIYGNNRRAGDHALVLHGNFLPYGGGSGNAGGSGSRGDYRLTVDSNGDAAYFDKIPLLALTQSLTTIPSTAVFKDGTATPSIIGNRVVINAATIDINGRISIGQQTDYNVNLSSTIGQSIRDFKASYDNPFLTSLYALFGITRNPTFDLTGVLAPSLNGKVTASFDARTGQVSVGKIESYSGGASLFLNGAIVNSNPNALAGQILVNGGFGNVTVTNQTGFAVALAGINTGDSATAAASVAKVQIRNTLITNGPDTKTYIYDPQVGVKTFLTNGGADPGVGAAFDTTTGNSVNYQTVIGARYDWALQAELERPSLFNPYNRGTNGYPGWVFAGTNKNDPWRYVNPSESLSNFSSSTQSTPFARVSVRTDLVGTKLYQQIDGNTLAGGTGFRMYLSHDAQNARGFVRQGDGLGHYRYDYPGRAFIKMLLSAKADYPINIQFTGNNAGNVAVTSNASVLLGGKIINPSGPTSIVTTAGDITQAVAGGIVTNNLRLVSAGAIGTPQVALSATLLGNGNLTALASSAGINLNLAGGDVRVGQISSRTGDAFGDVRVNANGSLVAGTAPSNGATPNAHVVGRNIQLVSVNGDVGTGLVPLVLSANGTGNAAGGLNVTAQGDIGITQQTGDLRLGQIVSKAGDITLNVPGRLLDASGQLSSEVLSPEQVAKVSKALRLTAADGSEDAIKETIKGFETLVARSLADYDALTGRGAASAGAAPVDPSILALYKPLLNASRTEQARTSYGQAGTPEFSQASPTDLANFANGLVTANGVFSLSTAEALDHYRPAATAALGLPTATVATNTQVQAWANAQYQSYVATFTKAYGDNWRTFVETSNRTPFTVAAASPLRETLARDAVWSTTELLQAVDRSALQPGQGTVGSGGTPNIVGRHVRLQVGQGIGQLASPMDISLVDLTTTALSNAQRAALVTATTPGSVTLTGTKSDGTPLPDDTTLTNLPSGATITGLKIKQTAPVFVKASGNFQVSSGDVIYLQGTGDASLNIDTMSAGGRVTLLMPGSITAARITGTTPNIVANGDLDMIADSGSVGTADAVLRYQTGVGILNSVSAGTGVYMSTAEDMRLGRVFAGATASLTSTGGFIRGVLPGITVIGESVILDAATEIGLASSRLNVAVGDTGVLSGRARGGAAYLHGAGPEGRTQAALRMGDFSTVNELDVLADNDLTLTGTLSASSLAAGSIKLRAASLTMTTDGRAEARRTIDALVNGDAVLGSLVTTIGAVPAIPAEAIRVISTFGAIRSAGDNLLNIDAGAGQSEVVLSAATGIGTLARPLTIKANILTADTLANDMVLAARSALYSPSLRATVGSIIITGTSNLDLAYLLAGNQIGVTNDGWLKVGTALSTNRQQYTAGGYVTFDTLVTTTGSGAIGVRSLSGNVTGTILNAKGTTTVEGFGVAVDTVTSGGQATFTSTGTLTGRSVQSGSGLRMQATGLIGWSDLFAKGMADLASSAGSIQLGSLQAGNALVVAAQDLTGTTLSTNQSGATLQATTGKLDWGTINLLGALVAKAGTTLDIDWISTRGAASTDSGGAQTLGIVNASGTFGANSRGTLTVDQVTTTGTQTVASVGRFGFNQLSATDLSGDITVRVTAGPVVGGTVRSQRNATIEGVGVSLASVITKGQMTLTATGGLAADPALGFLTSGSLSAGTGLLLRAAGLVDLTDVAAGATADMASTKGSMKLVSLRAGDAKVSAAQDLTAATTLLATRTAALTAVAGKLVWGGDINVGTTLTTKSGAAMTLGRITAMNGVTTDSGALQTLSVVNAGSSFTATSKGGLALTQASSTGAMRITALGDLQFGQISTTAIGGDITLAAGPGALTGTSVRARGNATLSGAGISVSDVVSAGSQVSLTSTAAATGNAISAGTGLTIRATGLIDWADIGVTNLAGITSDAGSVRIGNLRAADATITALQNVTGTNLTTTRTASLTATTGNLDWQGTLSIGTNLTTKSGGTTGLGKTTARGTVIITSGGAQTLSTVNATGAITATAVGGITATDLTSGAKVAVTSTGAGLVRINTSTGVDVALDSGGLLTIDKITARNSVKLGASEIRIATLQQTSDATSALLLDMTGSQGGTATYASVNVLTSRGVKTGQVRVQRLDYTVNGVVVTVTP